MNAKSALKGAAVSAAVIAATGGFGALTLTGAALAASVGVQTAGLIEQREAGKTQTTVRKRAEKKTKAAEALKVKATKEAQFANKSRRAERGNGGFTGTQAASLTLGASGRGGKKTLG